MAALQQSSSVPRMADLDKQASLTAGLLSDTHLPYSYEAGAGDGYPSSGQAESSAPALTDPGIKAIMKSNGTLET
jgi:hypothetical protein